MLRSVRKGTETVDEQIATIDELQVGVESYSRDFDPFGVGGVLRDLAGALLRLEVAVDAAGANYRYDAAVRHASKSVSYSAITAALKFDCPGVLT